MLGVLVLLLALLGWSFLPASAEAGQAVELEVRSEDRAQVIDELARLGLMDSPRLMKLYVSLLAPGVGFRPRQHLLGPGASPRALVRALGEVGRRPTTRVVLPEGSDRQEVARRLEERGVCSRRALLAASADPALLGRLGLGAPSAEGYLFPATYEFREDEDPARVVSRLVREGLERYERVVRELGAPDPDVLRLDLGRHEVLTLASVVERETAADSERPKVARVFLNRLLTPGGETGGRLESDPSAAYACRGGVEPPPESCAGFEGVPTPALLRDASNPYNTYRHAGLPPGPIGSPGEAALRAVLAPARGAWLYFVAGAERRHVFSVTFAEHRVAVRALREAALARDQAEGVTAAPGAPGRGENAQ